jgi:hypothetical protein
LTFIGAYGRKNSGKSLFLDKALNLATFEGAHVSNLNLNFSLHRLKHKKM